MSRTEMVLRVRVKSDLPFEEVVEIMERRAPEFAALPGLRQKYYMQDVSSGEFAGLYVWESPEALQEYRDSELRATIAEAYQAKEKPDIEVYRVVKILRDDVG
jgi:heme-degrading monooxygenase HmoA